MRAPVLCLLAASPLWAASLEENRQAIRKTIQLLEKGQDNQSEFLFVRRREVKELDSSGHVRFQESHTIRRELVDGHVVTRLLARDGETLSQEEARRQESEIRRQVAALASQPPKPAPKVKPEEAELIREFPDALDYELVGTETRSGRAASVYEFHPRRGYHPGSLKFHMFEKLRGKCWIDRNSGELLLVDAEVFDTVNVGFGILGKIYKGARFRMQRTEPVPGWWVVESQNIKYDARLLLFKTLRREVDIRYSDFQIRKP